MSTYLCARVWRVWIISIIVTITSLSIHWRMIVIFWRRETFLMCRKWLVKKGRGATFVPGLERRRGGGASQLETMWTWQLGGGIPGDGAACARTGWCGTGTSCSRMPRSYTLDHELTAGIRVMCSLLQFPTEHGRNQLLFQEPGIPKQSNIVFISIFKI